MITVETVLPLPDLSNKSHFVRSDPSATSRHHPLASGNPAVLRKELNCHCPRQVKGNLRNSGNRENVTSHTAASMLFRAPGHPSLTGPSAPQRPLGPPCSLALTLRYSKGGTCRPRDPGPPLSQVQLPCPIPLGCFSFGVPVV